MTLADYRKKRGEPVLADHQEHAEKHPSAMEYLWIGAILVVITSIEVGIYYIDMSHALLVTLLIVLSLIKFTFVVGWFMHLKFDSRLFTTAFVTGLATALAVFTVVIAALHGQLV